MTLNAIPKKCRVNLKATSFVGLLMLHNPSFKINSLLWICYQTDFFITSSVTCYLKLCLGTTENIYPYSLHRRRVNGQVSEHLKKLMPIMATAHDAEVNRLTA